MSEGEATNEEGNLLLRGVILLKRKIPIGMGIRENLWRRGLRRRPQ